MLSSWCGRPTPWSGRRLIRLAKARAASPMSNVARSARSKEVDSEVSWGDTQPTCEPVE